MPKITNEIYKEFLDESKLIDTLPPEEFNQKLDHIQYRNKHKTSQAKGLLALLYWSGARPAEIMQMTPRDFNKEGRFFKLNLTTLKRGHARVLLIPKNEELEEFYAYAKKGIPNHPIFYKFAKKTLNKVSWTNRKKYFKQTPMGLEEDSQLQKKSNLYDRISSNAYYLCQKWMGFPPYFLRHNRFTRVSEAGGSLETIKDLKGAKDLRSAAAYVRYSRKKQIANAKFIK